MSRIETLLRRLKTENRAGFAAFVTASDPDRDLSSKIIQILPQAGVDLIELGMPFSDPMAEGPAIQASSQRALAAGGCMKSTFAIMQALRQNDADTPVILMGYYNPVLAYGLSAFAQDAARAGADGLIIVDLPPEEDEELRQYARAAGLSLIRLVAPTSDAARLAVLLNGAESFLYYVSITGTTGAARPDFPLVAEALQHLRAQTQMPIALGFGIKTAQDVQRAAEIADIVVVGSAFVDKIATAWQENKDENKDIAQTIHDYAASLVAALRSVKKDSGKKTGA